MKKLIPLLSLTFLIGLFSSCILIANPEGLSNSSNSSSSSNSSTTQKYSITCYNVSTLDITDWCVVCGNKRYEKSSTELVPIVANGGQSKISNLPKGTYTVYVAFVPEPDKDYGDYKAVADIYLNSNKSVSVDDAFVDYYY